MPDDPPSVSADTAALVLLAVLGLALFMPSLAFLPIRGDDHHQLAAVLALKNPLPVFYGSFWGGYPYYRPLHTLLLWLGARVFGVTWWPHQLLSMMLHLLNAGLLYRILAGFPRSRRRARRLAFLVSALYLASIHTMETAVWVAARTDLLVGACLLAYLLHAVRRRAAGLEPDVRVVAALCVLALLGKESGVLVPLLAAGEAIRFRRPRDSRWPVLAAALAILFAYAAFRVVTLGTFAADTLYEERPILLFGGRDLTEVPVGLRAAGYGETVVKHVVALALPVFNNQGLFLSPARLVLLSPLWLLTPALLVLAWVRPLTTLQRQGLAILSLSALVHSSFFAGYLLFLGQIGLCLLIGGGRPRRGRAAEVICAVLVLTNVFFVGRFESDRLAGQRAELVRWTYEGVPADADPDLAEALMRRY